MKFPPPLGRVFISAAAAAFQLAAYATATPLEALHEALLNDIVEAYTTHEPSSCNSAASEEATTFTYDWPGTNEKSKWAEDFVPFEESLFQARMSHTASSGNRSWTIRIGSGGNIYSHVAPELHGETMPPQNHAEGP